MLQKEKLQNLWIVFFFPTQFHCFIAGPAQTKPNRVEMVFTLSGSALLLAFSLSMALVLVNVHVYFFKNSKKLIDFFKYDLKDLLQLPSFLISEMIL